MRTHWSRLYVCLRRCVCVCRCVICIIVSFLSVHSVSVSVSVCTGLVGQFTVNKRDGRASDFQLNIVQDSGMLPIGVYDHRQQQVVLYENVEYLWPDGTTRIPDELPICYQQTCYFISTYHAYATESRPLSPSIHCVSEKTCHFYFLYGCDTLYWMLQFLPRCIYATRSFLGKGVCLSVCPSVRPSVRHTRELWQNERKFRRDSYTMKGKFMSVSYTHLTLPTIYSV